MNISKNTSSGASELQELLSELIKTHTYVFVDEGSLVDDPLLGDDHLRLQFPVSLSFLRSESNPFLQSFAFLEVVLFKGFAFLKVHLNLIFWILRSKSNVVLCFVLEGFGFLVKILFNNEFT